MILRTKSGARWWVDDDSGRVVPLGAPADPAPAAKPRAKPDPMGRPIKAEGLLL